MNIKPTVHIIGAGPAGLSAARELSNRGTYNIYVLEKKKMVGGISRTESYNDYYFDIGGHRFYTKHPEIETIWQETLGKDFLSVRRLSRIYYKKRFLNYPLQFRDTIKTLGLYESMLISLSYIKAALFPQSPETTFEQWVINRFGKRLYHMFFKEYTEKVWGIGCDSIQADWAAQRIQGLSFISALKNAVLGTTGPTSLIEEFSYPRFGPGMMWEAFQNDIESKGDKVQLNCDVTRLKHCDGKICALQYRQNGKFEEEPVENIISSTPLNLLVQLLSPAAPDHILDASKRLSYRSFIIVVLIIAQKDLFPDQWLYVHSPDISAGRIQNFKNWSSSMVPDENTTSLGVEYFCTENDELWQLSDEALTEKARIEIDQLGVTELTDVTTSYIVRQPNAYPVYDDNFKHNVNLIKDYLNSFSNLQTVGRAGMHRYNNMDHSMITGILAARNLDGEEHDIWEINESEDYLEKNS